MNNDSTTTIPQNYFNKSAPQNYLVKTDPQNLSQIISPVPTIPISPLQEFFLTHLDFIATFWWFVWLVTLSVVSTKFVTTIVKRKQGATSYPINSVAKKNLLDVSYGTIFFLVAITLFSFALFASKKSSSSYNVSDYVKESDLNTGIINE